MRLEFAVVVQVVQHCHQQSLSFSWRRYLDDDDDIGSLVDPEACFQSDQGGDISISPVPVAKTLGNSSHKIGDAETDNDTQKIGLSNVYAKQYVDSDTVKDIGGQDSICYFSELTTNMNDDMRQGDADMGQCETLDLSKTSGSDLVFVIDENTLNEYLNTNGLPEYLNTKGLPLREEPLSYKGESGTCLPLLSEDEHHASINTELHAKPSIHFAEESRAELTSPGAQEAREPPEAASGSGQATGPTVARETRGPTQANGKGVTTQAASAANETMGPTQLASGAKETSGTAQSASDAKETMGSTQQALEAKETMGTVPPTVSGIRMISLSSQDARSQLRAAINKKLKDGHDEATGDGRALRADTIGKTASSFKALEKGDQISGCTIHYENEIVTGRQVSSAAGKIRQTNSLSNVERSSDNLCSADVDKNIVSSPCKRQRSATCLIENECTRRKL